MKRRARASSVVGRITKGDETTVFYGVYTISIILSWGCWKILIFVATDVPNADALQWPMMVLATGFFFGLLRYGTRRPRVRRAWLKANSIPLPKSSFLGSALRGYLGFIARSLAVGILLSLVLASILAGLMVEELIAEAETGELSSETRSALANIVPTILGFAILFAPYLPLLRAIAFNQPRMFQDDGEDDAASPSVEKAHKDPTA